VFREPPRKSEQTRTRRWPRGFLSGQWHRGKCCLRRSIRISGPPSEWRRDRPRGWSTLDVWLHSCLPRWERTTRVLGSAAPGPTGFDAGAVEVRLRTDEVMASAKGSRKRRVYDLVLAGKGESVVVGRFVTSLQGERHAQEAPTAFVAEVNVVIYFVRLLGSVGQDEVSHHDKFAAHHSSCYCSFCCRLRNNTASLSLFQKDCLLQNSWWLSYPTPLLLYTCSHRSCYQYLDCATKGWTVGVGLVDFIRPQFSSGIPFDVSNSDLSCI
jgi:hypothetical protein